MVCVTYGVASELEAGSARVTHPPRPCTVTVPGDDASAMNGLVIIPRKMCVATREPMRKEDEAGDEF